MSKKRVDVVAGQEPVKHQDPQIVHPAWRKPKEEKLTPEQEEYLLNMEEIHERLPGGFSYPNPCIP